MATTESLPEFLDELVVRSQCWCSVSVAGRNGFSVGPNDAILLYVVLKGSVLISSAPNHKASLEAGDMAVVMNRRPHTVRTDTNCTVEELSFLNSAQYIDSPPAFAFGSGTPDLQILCGRLKVRWPGDFRPADLPAILRVPAARSLVRLDTLVRNSQGKGAAATLTHAASLVLVSALSQQPEFQALFSGENARSPIARAIKLMEERPYHGWTLGLLAREVGMGRTVFATRFLAEIGRPPFEVLTELRMELARKLLLQTEMKISEVGEKVGYRSESAFHRRFTLYFNIPPGKMRFDRKLWKRRRSDLRSLPPSPL